MNMSFLEALREAKDNGISTDDFMKMWHMIDLRSKNGSQLEERQQNLRKGNQVTSPTMSDKSKRLGWISPGPYNFAQPFGEATHDEPISEGNLNVPDAAPRHDLKPLKSPRALPRRRKQQPPAYEQAQEYRYADENDIRFSQQTERKLPHDSDVDSDSSSDEGSSRNFLPNVSDLQQLEADQQTVPKVVYANVGTRRRKETPSGPYESVDDIFFSKEEQSQLMDTLRHLQDEQQALKSKLREHDIHLTSLLEKQPSVRQTLRHTINRGQNKVVDQTRNQTIKDMSMLHGKVKGLDAVDNDHLYVQIEQLYSNFCKMHVPANSIKWMLKWDKSSQLLRSRDDSDIVQDTFARRENSQGYWDIVSIQESLALQKENDELKAKVRMLEAKLEERQSEPNPPESKVKSPDRLMPTIASMPRLCNVRLSKLKNGKDSVAKSNKHAGNLKKKAHSEPSTSEVSVVAGCPVEAFPGMGSVKTVKMKFEWRISNFAKKLEMERKGQQTKIVSNPFYINHNGYLAQLEVYLNGNSTGKDKCMSVFLRILKGTYDGHLQWPVRLCFVVLLFNQTEGKRESLKGGADGFNEFEYNKPIGCSNDSCDCRGFVEFVSHNKLAQRKYICNDSILLGVSLKML